MVLVGTEKIRKKKNKKEKEQKIKNESNRFVIMRKYFAYREEIGTKSNEVCYLASDVDFFTVFDKLATMKKWQKYRKEKSLET